MRAEFTVPGVPMGKQRPRFKQEGKYVRTYTPHKTVVYENLIRMEYERQCSGVFFQKDVPVSIEVTAYYGIPKSTSKKKVWQMLSWLIRPLKRPDLDNVLKAVLDACNGVVFHDDAQVTDIRASKYYGDIPRVDVIISEAKERLIINQSEQQQATQEQVEE